jgi:hypothetical protein
LSLKILTERRDFKEELVIGACSLVAFDSLILQRSLSFLSANCFGFRLSWSDACLVSLWPSFLWPSLVCLWLSLCFDFGQRPLDYFSKLLPGNDFCLCLPPMDPVLWEILRNHGMMHCYWLIQLRFYRLWFSLVSTLADEVIEKSRVELDISASPAALPSGLSTELPSTLPFASGDSREWGADTLFVFFGAREWGADTLFVFFGARKWGADSTRKWRLL